MLDTGIRRSALCRATLVAGCWLALTVSTSSPAGAQVLLNADFTSTSWYTSWQNNSTSASLTSEPANTTRIAASTTTAGFVPLDGPALKVTIPQGEQSGTGLSFYPRALLGKDPSELYLRYYIRFGSDWNNAQNGKLPGFGGTYDIGGWGGKPSDGTNGWSARGKFGEPCSNGKVHVGSYVYHADMVGQYGQSFTWTNGCTSGLNKNQWYAIEYYVKVNTPGSSDGILRGWIDNRLAMEETGLRFDDTGKFQIERVWMNVFHGGSKLAPQTMHLFIDNVIVSTKPIGSEIATPNPPAELTVE